MIDPLLSSWILEFAALHLPTDVDDRLLLSLLTSLPSPSPSNRLAALLLLRRLRPDHVSEPTLDSLELLDALLPGKRSSLAAAYAAAAADCTVRHLREGDRPGGKGFTEAVERVWVRRVGDLLRAEGEGSGLRSGELEKWKKGLERAVGNGSMRRLLVGVDTRRKAAEAVGTFVEEMQRELGKPFLDFAAERWLAEQQANARGIDGNVGEAGEKSEIAHEQGPATGACGKSHRIHSPEVVKVKEARRASCASLCSTAQDPLPDSIPIEAGVSNEMIGKALVNPKDLERPITVGADAIGASDKVVESTKEASTSSLDNANKVRGRKFSLMDRNPTVQTYEWGDDSLEESMDASKKIRVSSLKRRNIAPLELQKLASFSRRRKKKRWSVKEEEALHEAVKKYGVGNWKFILNCHRTIFEGRTEVDLKDKWRNMTR